VISATDNHAYRVFARSV